MDEVKNQVRRGDIQNLATKEGRRRLWSQKKNDFGRRSAVIERTHVSSFVQGALFAYDKMRRCER